MKIYLIRHGKTDWNRDGRIQGRQDIPLNEEGRKQAAAVAKAMEAHPVTAIYSSSQQRALETAKAVGHRLRTDVCVVEGLGEMGYGLWEGLTGSEIKARYPREYASWSMDSFQISPPEGESRRDVMARAAGAVEGILLQARGDIAIVSHGATLCLLLAYLFRDTPNEVPESLANAGITTIECNRLTQSMALLEVDNTTHLTECI